MQVLDFAKYILALNPEANAARLSLYHYLKNLRATNEPLTDKTIESFYCRALTFSHWRSNRSVLCSEVKSLLESFLETHDSSFRHLKHADDMQVIELESIVDLYEVVKAYGESTCLEAERIRVLPDADKGMVLVKLHANGEIEVSYFDFLATIRKGRIEPLATDLRVKYNQRLEPATQYQHLIQIQPGVVSRFTVSDAQALSGRLVKGFAFQRLEDFDGIPLTKYPVIFYPLKRLERFFINRSSDPLYAELTQLLDQSILLMREKHPDAVKLARASYERGHNALQMIFPDDKVLGLLLRELETLLREKTEAITWEEQFDLTST